MHTLAVVIPTKNRPNKLRKCLEYLARARVALDFVIYVCDSSTQSEAIEEVKIICAQYSFVELHFHKGHNVAAARNFCAQVATEDLLINVDDDVYVEPDSIKNLYYEYKKGAGWRIVSGSVAWGNEYSKPVVMRRIGYGRNARPNELPDFVIGAFFLYPRLLPILFPWNDRIRTSDDRFIGAVWRSQGVYMMFAPDARAQHDHEPGAVYGIEHQEYHIYANLFDAIFVRKSLYRACCYEVLGFIYGAKRYVRNATDFAKYSMAWWRGHKAMLRDWSYLRNITLKNIPSFHE